MKKKTLTCFILLGVFLAVTYCCHKILEYYEECNCSKNEFVANGQNIWVEFGSSFNLSDLKAMTIEVLGKKKIKYIKLQKANYFNRYEILINAKIMVSDTLLIKVRNQKIKIYDFKNGGIRQKAGQNKGVYFCGIESYKIDSKIIDNQGLNTIYVEE
ncbi:hypothetical protein ABXT06_14150 [Flavobacterium sp. UW10123]|uniref:hypothetical protein n=1 Tax=Flavobacterium sp. UW10123 TaxID=3230800 RepID=UPI0033938DF4